MLDDRIEHRCRAIDVSPAGLALLAPARGDIGQRLVCYLDELGRLEGRIVRLFEDGFAVELSNSAGKREKLAQQLALRARHPAQVQIDPARMPRRSACRSVAILHLPDSRRVRVQILDMTEAGATVLCPLPIPIGASVLLGERSAHVSRVTQALIGLQFAGLPGEHAPSDGPDASERGAV